MQRESSERIERIADLALYVEQHFEGFSIDYSENLALEHIRYVILDQHGAGIRTIPPGLARLLPREQTGEMLAELCSKMDVGSRSMVQGVLRSLPGGVALCVDIPRGFIDMNRVKVAGAGSARPVEFTQGIKTMVSEDNFPAAIRWAHKVYDDFRGEWQLECPDNETRLSEGLLQFIASLLNGNVMWWDFHTCDAYGEIPGTRTGRRPVIQLLTRNGPAASADALSLIDPDLVNQLSALILGSRVLSVIAEECSESELLGVDDPFFLDIGCTSERIAMRRKHLLVTEVRKDLLNPVWCQEHSDYALDERRRELMLQVFTDLGETALGYYQ